MCRCTLEFDIRCRCTPTYNYGEFQNCPVRIDTAVWLIDNESDTHVAARQRDFTMLCRWFHLEVDRRQAELIYVDNMIEEICKDYIERLPVSIAREHDYTEEDWIEADMACNEQEKQRQELIRWLQRRIELRIRIRNLEHQRI